MTTPTPDQWRTLVEHLARVGVEPSFVQFLAGPRFDLQVSRGDIARLDYRARRHVFQGVEWLAGSAQVDGVQITAHTGHVPHDPTVSL